MSWWRKKQEQDDDKDNILDLDTVVWWGMKPQDRLERLAATAEAEDNMRQGNMLDPVKNNYVPTNPLPSVPLPVQEVSRFVEDDHPEPIPEKDYPSRDLTVEEQMIEAEIREQIMAGVHAEMSNPAAQQPTEEQQSSPQSVTPDVSDAIKAIVADEIGGWLSHNVQRIIAESVTASLDEKGAQSPAPSAKKQPSRRKAKKPSSSAKEKTPLAKKSSAKSAKKNAAKATKKTAKTKAPQKGSASKAKKST